MEQPIVNGAAGSPVKVMPPRSSSHLKFVPLQLQSVTESMEAKLKRLRPSPPEERSEAPAVEAGVPDGTRPHCESAPVIKKHYTLHITRSDTWWPQCQVRPSSNAISSFRSAGENALADDLFKVRAHFSYASSASRVTHMLHHRHSTHTPSHRCFAAYPQHRLIDTFPSKEGTACHCYVRHQHHTSRASVEGTLQHICYGTALAIT